MSETRTYTLTELQSMLANLENVISCEPQTKVGKCKRVKLPIPEEYGGGVVTGFGYEDTVRKLIFRIQGQLKTSRKGPSFKTCWEQWIDLKSEKNLSPATLVAYKGVAKRYLLPFFGDIRIDEITPDDIQRYYNSIMNLSYSVGNQSKAILCGIFDRAARMGYTEQNIMLYKYDRPDKKGEKTVLQDTDLVNVIKQMDQLEGSDYLYFCFLCFTALRRGEILGLKWEDIDFDRKEIHVHNNVIFPDGDNDPVEKEPKDGSIGVIYLPSELLKRIEPYRLSKGYVIRGSQSDSTKPISRSSFTKMWYRIKKAIDLKGATSHSFRATYATMMNAHCNHVDPKVLQGALRHKTPDLALKVYTKKNEDKTRQAEMEYDEWISSQLSQTS